MLACHHCGSRKFLITYRELSVYLTELDRDYDDESFGVETLNEQFVKCDGADEPWLACSTCGAYVADTTELVEVGE